jgi:hypothetical protein
LESAPDPPRHLISNLGVTPQNVLISLAFSFFPSPQGAHRAQQEKNLSLLYPIPPDVLVRHFRYRGWFCGIVPVYVGPLKGFDGPNVTVRNGIPEWTLDAAGLLWNGFVALAVLINPVIQPQGWPIRITGRLDGAPLSRGELS